MYQNLPVSGWHDSQTVKGSNLFSVSVQHLEVHLCQIDSTGRVPSSRWRVPRDDGATDGDEQDHRGGSLRPAGACLGMTVPRIEILPVKNPFGI